MNYFAYCIGLDLGQRADYSALSILEEQLWIGEWQSPAEKTLGQLQAFQQNDVRRWPGKPPLAVRHLERFPLGTPYPEIVREVSGIVNDPAIRQYGYALICDATGVGRPVIDLFREAHLRPIAVTITGGNQSHRDRVTGEWSVPKRDLVSAVQSTLQTDRLLIADGLTHAETLIRELLNFKVTINVRTAHDSYGAWREGIHDDLVLSVAMAAWFRDRWFRSLDTQRMNRAIERIYA